MPPPPPRAGAIEGVWSGPSCSVRWRLGRVDDRASSGETARTWIRDLVREHDLFAWGGFAETAPGVKPRLETDVPADASLSHRRGFVLVAVAVGAGASVGADVEVAPYDAFDSSALVRRMLTRDEERRVAELPERDRRAALTRIWTAKESFVKATGEGLARDFRGFAVPEPPVRPVAPVEACVVVLSAGVPPRFLRPDFSPAD